MTNQLTTDQLKELLDIQKQFDSRIPTLNLQDSKVAYVVEFFEWFNTLETFKNWKKKPGKPLDVQLDELADMLAFGLSIANQMNVKVVEIEFINKFLESWSNNEFLLNDGSQLYELYDALGDLLQIDDYDNNDALSYILLPIGLATQFYTINQLITAYKKKMERNHARQDGTADTDKGYV